MACFTWQIDAPGWHAFRAARSRLLGAALWLAVISVTVAACAWLGVERSIRFRGASDFKWVSRLPPLPSRIDSATGKLCRANPDDSDDYNRDYQAGKERASRADALFVDAGRAEDNGYWKQAHLLLNSYIRYTAIERDNAFFEPLNRQLRRNSAFDQLDIIDTLDRGSTAVVRAYLDARRAYDQWVDLGARDNGAPRETLKSRLDNVPRQQGIDENVAYLEAAILYKLERYEDASRAFGELVIRYPRGRKRESSLYMRTMSLMKLSDSYYPASADQPHPAASVERPRRPVPSLGAPDSFWHQASDGFARLINKYPRGRYVNDARGWLAFLKLRAGDRTGALLDYYRLLSESDPDIRTKAVFSLTLVRHHASDYELDRLEASLEREPAVALVYAYHGMYNYAINPGCSMETQSDDEQQCLNRQAEHGRKELERIARFTARLMRLYPKLAFGSGFSVRAAEANLELGSNAAALDLARRAISAGAKGRERGQALWVQGVAQQRLSRFDAARRSFTVLIRENSSNELVEGARKLLALVEEDAGNYGAALEQYLALDYGVDAAYLVDVLMAPESLAHFVDTHPNSQYRDGLLYSLGIRYMRKGMWADARRAFTQVHTSPEPIDVPGFQPPGGFQVARMTRVTPKAVSYDDASIHNGVRNGWLLQDLVAVADLEKLELDARNAPDGNDRAEALYRLASYQYDGSTLMYYNPWAWGGWRMQNLEFLDSSGYRAASEAVIVWEYFQAHEPVVHALDIYMRIAEQYSNTKVAPLALYTAAVCHDRLTNYDEYWRKAYEKGQHAGVRVVDYGEVRARYPKFQLPRGTIGWEPSNATVNGGPAWAAPPRPPRRIPARERLARMAQQRVEEAWNSLVKLATKAIQFAFSMLVLALVAIVWWLMLSSGRKLIEEVRSCKSIPRALLPPYRPGTMAIGLAIVPRLSILPSASKPLIDGEEQDGYEAFLGNCKMDEWTLAARAKLYPIANYVFNSARGAALIVQAFVVVLTVSLVIAILLLV